MPAPTESRFDVFISYNRRDEEPVLSIARSLEQYALRVWLDQWELQPGRPWLQKAQADLESCSALAFFVGANGLGAFQDREIQAFLECHVYDQRPLVPVKLPTAPAEAALPPFLRQLTWVEFRTPTDEEALGRLYWGITGKKLERNSRRNEAPSPINIPTDGEQVHEASVALAEYLRPSSRNVTFFIGSGATSGGVGLPPRRSELARELLTDIGVIKRDYASLLPPIDVVGLYYALKHGAPRLEEKLVDLLLERVTQAPTALRSLALLLIALVRRPQGRVRRRAQQLVVTTNLDLMIERVFLQCGVPFTRLVQDRSTSRVVVNRYDHVELLPDGSVSVGGPEGDRRVVPTGDLRALDEAIAAIGVSEAAAREARFSGGGNTPLAQLSLEGYAEPIVFKLLGSLDVEDSCAISTDQYLDLLRRIQSQRLIPQQIGDIVQNSGAVFLGYSLLDPDFRLLYHALLREAYQMAADRDLLRYALQLPPALDDADGDCVIESAVWSRLKATAPRQMGITIVEDRADAFLDRVRERVPSA